MCTQALWFVQHLHIELMCVCACDCMRACLVFGSLDMLGKKKGHVYLNRIRFVGILGLPVRVFICV